jgi:hypothetical protein
VSFTKTQVYLDNPRSLFGRSELVLTNKDSSRFCYISNFYTCDHMLYRGTKYKLNDLDIDDAKFFQDIWDKPNNRFFTSPVEFGELSGQNRHLNNLAEAIMFITGICSLICSIVLLLTIIMRACNRLAK